MRKQTTMFYALFLALTLMVSGCGDRGPAGAPGAQGEPGINGTTGTQGPVGQTGTTGGTISDPFQVANFHGGAYAPEALRGTNNSANLCTTITGALMNASGKVEVDFTVKSSGTDKIPCTADDVAYTGLPQSLPVSFYLAELRPGDNTGDSTYWVSYINVTGGKTRTTAIDPSTGLPFGTTAVGYKMNQASTESSTLGTWTEVGGGAYHYVTATAVNTEINIAANNTDVLLLPRGGVYPYDANNPVRVGITLADHDGTGPATAGANNPTYDFIPATNTPIADPREIVVIANCNECHKTLGAHHAGGRNDTKLCVICHNPTHGDPESGNILDLKVMVHKIHMGEHLPSVKAGGTYKIWGNANNVHDYSNVLFPAYPANCTKCHKNASLAGNYLTKPTKEACGACHDGINFADFAAGARVAGVTADRGTALTDFTYFQKSNQSTTGHAANENLADNSRCSECHSESRPDYVISSDAPSKITGSHDFMNKIKSEYTVDIQMSTPANGSYYVAGEKPVVTITIRDQAGNPVDPTTITDVSYPSVSPRGTNGGGALNLYISGPRAKRVPALTTSAVEPTFFSTATPKVPDSSPRNDLRIRTNKALQDDFGTRDGGATADATKVTGVRNRATAGTDMNIQYQLADVTGRTPGTYSVYVHFYKPFSQKLAVGSLTTFKVGQATDELRTADGCSDCHDINAMHITTNYEHPAQFNTDYCGNCHDYFAPVDAKKATAGTGQVIGAWGSGSGTGGVSGNKLGFGNMPISKRVHAAHFGARLTYPADASISKYAVFPQDVRNCEKCHPSTTTGTWRLTSANQKDSAGLALAAKTQARAACSGCHDSDAQWGHMTLNTVDPTPTTVTTPAYPATSGPFSGDETETCDVCHRP